MSTTVNGRTSRPTYKYNLEDVDWMLECGEHPERIAARVGATIASIEARYRTAGEHAKANTFARSRAALRRVRP